MPVAVAQQLAAKPGSTPPRRHQLHDALAGAAKSKSSNRTYTTCSVVSHSIYFLSAGRSNLHMILDASVHGKGGCMFRRSLSLPIACATSWMIALPDWFTSQVW